MKNFIRRRISQQSLTGDDAAVAATTTTPSPRPPMPVASNLSLSSMNDENSPTRGLLMLSPSTNSSTDGSLRLSPQPSSDPASKTKATTTTMDSFVIRWLAAQWRNGDWRDKLALLLLAILFVGSALLTVIYMVTPLVPDSVTVANGLRIPIHATGTIHIPMEDIPRNTPPSMVLFRSFMESWSQRQLRRTGERALIQFGQQLRELMLLGGDVFHPKTTKQPSAIDPYKAGLFRQKIKAMAPWLRGDATQEAWPMNQVPTTGDPNSRAVVICAGDKQMTYLQALLNTIRNVHKSTIPIRIVYKGDTDLSPESRTKLTQQFNSNGGNNDNNALLKFIDLSVVFELDAESVQLRGWNLKPFGMLAVPESQVVLLDVDVLLLRPPEDLFEQHGFRDKGALFFRDRSGGEHLWTPRQFLLTMQPVVSKAAQRSLVNGNVLNEHIQEAGVVLIDKSRRWRGLWTACLILGRWDVRRFIQRDMIYGDKEVYFTAFETIHEPYSFARYYPGVIGSVLSDFHGDDIEWAESNADTVSKHDNLHILRKRSLLREYMALCGRMLHFDDEGLPLWSNGGYLTREDDRTAKADVAETLKPILFADGGDSTTESGGGGPERNQKWLFNHDLGVLCLFPNKRAVRHVKAEVSQSAKKAVDFYVANSREGVDRANER